MTFLAGLGLGFLIGTSCCVASWLTAHLKSEDLLP